MRKKIEKERSGQIAGLGAGACRGAQEHTIKKIKSETYSKKKKYLHRILPEEVLIEEVLIERK